ncbi:methyltransferase domain-containing protein [Frankia sp. CNm7]|uniref:Methyltransferase domain-containing protein n=1 Tax=Frankia nepalensis TaxID=1836974 RepID=A0A937RJ25_9ACTN|nr:methyltransferase domain-containing protein [Frankia nepalensis]MBL7500742.1 methyltransferase domain-containing protein [Frankia nepalensis]MBL7511770.1 methyltransferase domain-containing protein [Frankia nepalensis]MBL7519889.1 methyltransferase domain-containing protein [Frankia nepalensis]MBL7633186.1 methyltransferase domain-containing protein [Frankia nepalensis]
MLSGPGTDPDLGDPEFRYRPAAPTVVCEAPAGSDDPYWSFYDEVAAVQLREWLPAASSRVLDVSGQRDRFARQMAAAGHRVVRVVADQAQPAAARQGEHPDGSLPPGGLLRVAGDARSLDWFAPESFDAVLAEGRALSFCLATESTLEEIYRLLRPGGQLLLCVDSLLLGLARLAEQHRWAELSDVPRADVVLVPAEDGTITRCFWPEELKAVLTSAGLQVDWVRPRSVLSAEAVKRALAADMSSFPTLVRTEVELAAEREGESIGIHLIASARRPA